MATIGNLGAADSSRIVRLRTSRTLASNSVQVKGKRADGIPFAPAAPAIRRTEEAPNSRESSERRGRAIESSYEQPKRMSLDELAEALRKVNLTFDLFEIQTRFIIDSTSGDISVQIINQRTGEVIRKIPPYELPQVAQLIESGEPLVTDVKV